jgi:hypothetical protein
MVAVAVVLATWLQLQPRGRSEGASLLALEWARHTTTADGSG